MKNDIHNQGCQNCGHPKDWHFGVIAHCKEFKVSCTCAQYESSARTRRINDDTY